MRLIALCPLLVLTLSGCSAVAYKATMPDVSLNCVGDLKSLPATPLRFPVIGPLAFPAMSHLLIATISARPSSIR